MKVTRLTILVITLSCSFVLVLSTRYERSKENNTLPYSVVKELIKSNLQERLVSKVVLDHDEDEGEFVVAGKVKLKLLFKGENAYTSVGVPNNDADDVIRAFTKFDVPVWAIES